MAENHIIQLLITYKYAILLPIAIPEWPIIAVIAAFLAAQHILNIYIVFVIIVIGDLIGDTIWYWIARVWARSALLRFGHFIHITEAKIDITEKHLRKHFFKTMLFGKITNVPMLSIIIAAGITKIDFGRFIIYVFLLALPKTFILLLVGYFFGTSYPLISHYMDVTSQIVLFALLGIALFYFIYVYTKRFTLKKNDKIFLSIKRYVNIDYLKPMVEGKIAKLCASRIERVSCINGKILIIAPCLIGDFVASVPAIFDFIERNADKKIDIVVTPVLKELTQRIRGIHNVFVAKSVAERSIECGDTETGGLSGTYEEVIVLRTSQDVLDNIIPFIRTSKVRHMVKEVARYSVSELLKNNILRRRPKQWREFNFELLGGVARHISFEEIFDLTKEEGLNGLNGVVLVGLHPAYKKIVIHTGASWPMMRWSNDNWTELLKRIHGMDHFDMIFIGSEKDRDDYEYISSRLDFPVFSLISRVDVLELTLSLYQVEYFLGIDSGPGNIAHLVWLRSLIIYGPGPHTFMSDDIDDVIVDRSNGRGLFQRYFLLKKGFIDQISIEDVTAAFTAMHTKSLGNQPPTK